MSLSVVFGSDARLNQDAISDGNSTSDVLISTQTTSKVFDSETPDSLKRFSYRLRGGRGLN